MKNLILLLSMISLLGFPQVVCAEEDEVQEPFVYDDGGRRDPFWPLVEASGTVRTYESNFLISDLALEGIMYSPNNRGAAIINGRVVKTGDTIGQYRVIEVMETAVTLIKGDERFELRLKKGE